LKTVPGVRPEALAGGSRSTEQPALKNTFVIEAKKLPNYRNAGFEQQL
jgi:hypothetical protein